MAITTYSELQDAIADWLNKSNLTNEIVDFISLAESDIQDLVNLMNIEAREKITTTAGVSYILLPTYSRGVKSAHIEGSPIQVLEQVPLTKLLSSELRQEEGKPKIFAVSDNSIVLAPVPNDGYDLRVTHAKFEPLSGSNDSNGVLEEYPNLYLAASLVWAYSYLKNDEKIAYWTNVRDSIISQMNLGQAKRQFGSSPIRQIPKVVV